MLVQDPAFAHALLLSLRSGLIAIDGDGCIAAISAEAARLLGVAPRLGEPVASVLAAQPEVFAQLEAARLGRPAPRSELTLRGPGGEIHTIGYTAVPVANGGAAILFRDLTPIERESEQSRLVARLAALGQMAAGLAHEIRNPLASIELLAGLVAREAGDSSGGSSGVKDLAGEISREVHAIEATVEACLAWVKPEPVQRAPLALAALVDDALRRALGRAPFAGGVARELDPRASGSGDHAMLRAALENLVLNAVQAMSAYERGEPHALAVRVSPLAGASGFAISVEDTGPGVSPELRERIFFPFFTTRASGSGIGLAWVQKAVAAHGGSVGVADRPGGGARFTLYIPEPAQ
ncbi:MAG TPA: ATP-binding protein [Myxococcota bacterium]|nr:ATP-binding protein [Myxococcota bacterium]